jgi:hypothetical protein
MAAQVVPPNLENDALIELFETTGLDNQVQNADGDTALEELVEIAGADSFDMLSRVSDPEKWATELMKTVNRADSEFRYPQALTARIALTIYYVKDRTWRGLDYFEDDGQGNGTLLGFDAVDQAYLHGQMEMDRNLKTRSNTDPLPAFRQA